MLRIILTIVLGFASVAAAAAGPRVAVWDPQFGTRETRFTIDRELLDHAAQWLAEAGVSVQRITAEQMREPASFSAERFDVLVLDGITFPRAAAPALHKFLDDGGVLIALDTLIPLLIGIEPETDQPLWTMSPREPRFAWQSGEFHSQLGIQYVHNPRMHDEGFRHTATPLLKRYLPEASDLPARRLPSRWLPQRDKSPGTYYPLIRSRRLDEVDVTPQVYLVRNGRRSMIVSSGIFTAGRDRELFAASGAPMVVALARLAGDVRAGAIELTDADKIDLPANLPPVPPLSARLSTGGVDPESARPLARWGQFDGSCIELAPALKGEAALTAADRFPRALLPGASVKLAVKDLAGPPHFLRIRGAYEQAGAALSARWNGRAVLSEAFVHLDTSGKGNYQAPGLEGVAFEFHRIVFLPPAEDANSAGELVLSNPGSAPVWFDAVQIENRTEPGREMLVGLGGGYDTGTIGTPSPLPRQISRTWSRLRGSARLQHAGPPDDAQRWKRIETILNEHIDVNPRVDVIIEGTPPWAAVSPERLAEAEKARRPHTVPPDIDAYAQLVEQFIDRFGDHIDAYEIWNEPNIIQYWRGSIDEYVAMYLRLAPIIRSKDPTARIIAAGMAGVHEEFVQRMVDSGAMAMADLVAIHPYAGKSPAWDVVYSQCEGTLFSHGIATEIYSNESGFPWLNTEWFAAPPAIDPKIQADLINRGMARLMSNGVAKVNVFHAGGDRHPFGLFDEKGKPRPAYDVFADYLALALNGGRRLDVSCVAGDDSVAPLEGIYAAAAAHADGSVTAVVNPAEYEPLRPPTLMANPSTEFHTPQRWTTFFGKATYANGMMRLSVEPGKQYVGSYMNGGLDLQRWPILEIVAPEAAGHFQVNIKVDGQDVVVLKDAGAGTHSVDLRPLVKLDRPTVAQLLVRAYGDLALDAVRFRPAPDSTPADAAAWNPAPVPARLAIPLSHDRPVEAIARTAGVDKPVPVQVHTTGAQRWAEVTVPLTARTLITLRPQ